jgi:hypothetical protein
VVKALINFSIIHSLRNRIVTRLILLATFGLFISLIDPGPKFTDLDKYRLKGRVKSAREIKYSLAEEGDAARRDKVLFQKNTFFDIEGYETQSTLFKNGNEYLLSMYTIGSEGKQVEMKEYNPDGTLNLLVSYKYDDKGFRSEAFYTWSDNRQIGEKAENTDYFYEIINNDLFVKVLYKNEYRGFCAEEKYLKADSSMSFMFSYKYDFNGNRLESAYFHGNGKLSWLTKYKYDRYNNLIESRVYKSNRIAVISTYKHEFDATGNWIIRKEDRDVNVNILTAGLERANTITERIFEYY